MTAKSRIRVAALCSGFVSLIVLTGFAPFASAASPSPSSEGSITLSPPLKQLTLGPGLLVAQTNISLTNNTNQNVSATIKLVDFKTLNDFGGVSLDQVGVPSEKYGLANWMTLPGGNNIVLTKGQTTNVTVYIQNRYDLAPGGHYGAVVINTSVLSDTGGVASKVSLKQQLVSLMFVKKLGGEHYGLQLQSMKTNTASGLPTTATMEFRSTGNVYVIPRGFIEVTDPKGKLVEKGIINQDSGMIMQGSSQQLITLLPPVDSSNLSGRYKLTAYYRYDGASKYDSKTIYFTKGSWSPGRTLVAVLTGVILLIVLYVTQRFRRKKYRKKLLSRYFSEH